MGTGRDGENKPPTFSKFNNTYSLLKYLLQYVVVLQPRSTMIIEIKTFQWFSFPLQARTQFPKRAAQRVRVPVCSLGYPEKGRAKGISSELVWD